MVWLTAFLLGAAILMASSVFIIRLFIVRSTES